MKDEVIVEISEFPESVRRLYQIFTQINTHLTFLCSHSRSVIPTFELLHKLNHDITKLDLTIIKNLFPEGDIFFGYVDENQVMLSFLEKVQYNKRDGFRQNEPVTVEDEYEKIAKQSDVIKHSKQLLIFDFQDVRVKAATIVARNYKKRPREDDSNNEFFLSSSSLTTQSLSQTNLMAIIKSRNEKFKTILWKQLQKYNSFNDPFEMLALKFESKIPIEPGFEHPVSSKGSEIKLNQTPNTKGTEEMISVLKDESFYKDQIVSIHTLNSTQEADYRKFSNHEMIHPDLKQAFLEYKGIALDEDLYSHQVEALESLIPISGIPDHVIVSTSTASGKSLIYQVPILNDILWDIERGNKSRGSTALFIFPTKALAQDQKRHLEELISHIPMNNDRRIVVDTYDGDTPFKDRKTIRQYADIIFTNPDLIHVSLLPHYTDKDWQTFIKNLKYIVLDELHVYRGTFGVHVSYIMGRLMRLHKFINSGYQTFRFISCSATISDPESHFRTICRIPQEEHIVHVSIDGSPCVEKKLIVWRPPPLMNIRGQTPTIDGTNQLIPRVNIIPESAKILVQLLCKLPDVRVILFCPIRAMCELVMKEVRIIIKSMTNPNILESDVMAYRGGYSKSDRRIIEQKMFTGELRAIVATNALELGIDLSYLDVVITCGFPTSKSNMHQQFGRAGRGKNSCGSLAIYVASGMPVDQYYLDHSEELCVKGSYEDLCVENLSSLSTSNFILEQHLQCAAFEEPIDLHIDLKWFTTGEGSQEAAKIFEGICKSRLIENSLRTFGPNPIYLPNPASMVSIRAIENDTFAVVDITKDRNIVIEEVEASRTSFTLYEGGIFLHQGLPYLVKEFNAKEKFAKVERVQVDWTTQQRDFKDVDPMEIQFVKELYSEDLNRTSDIPIFFGKVQITLVVFGFFKINRKREFIEAVESKNPPVIIKSRGFWVDIPDKAVSFTKAKDYSLAGGIHAAEHAIMNMSPLFIGGNSIVDVPLDRYSAIGEYELNTECKAPEKEFSTRQSRRKRPARLIFYDSKGGESGSGMSAKVFEYFDDLLFTTYHRIKACECEWGCPNCVAGTHCSEMSTVMSKPGAMIILASLLGLDLETEFKNLRMGPELNMPEISHETIETKSSIVKFAKDVQIVKVRKARKSLQPITVKKEE
ncbi:uncharacterized protein RJT21DRAFT_126636 [Scheffersomyces amazonensis]|uniref:uncharacterized protein n=1 Tax=Scheffersomyces amazonensis TaxID=1078765 RepID=UPI00315CB391